MPPSRNGSGVDLTLQVADAVFNTIRSRGPSVASIISVATSKQVVIMPTYAIFPLRGVLPSGVWQHAVCQRSLPLSDNDMQMTY